MSLHTVPFETVPSYIKYDSNDSVFVSIPGFVVKKHAFAFFFKLFPLPTHIAVLEYLTSSFVEMKSTGDTSGPWSGCGTTGFF
jgi:hypothetical protein